MSDGLPKRDFKAVVHKINVQYNESNVEDVSYVIAIITEV